MHMIANAPDHLLSLGGLDPAGLESLMALAAELKADPTVHAGALGGRSVLLHFTKPSTRTRVSFEAAVVRLGGHPIFAGPDQLQLGRGEPIADTARVISRYCAAIVIRTHAHADVEEFAWWSSVPVVNALTDTHHPCQALADLLTLHEHFGSLAGLEVAYVGDGNNVAHSLIEAVRARRCARAPGLPRGLPPGRRRDRLGDRRRRRDRRLGARARRSRPRPSPGAHAVYTDVFVSMGEEDVREAKLAVLGRYQVDETLMARARPDAVFMHCLPAHRGEEVDRRRARGPAVGRLRPGREPAPHGRGRAGDAHQPVAARTMRAMAVRESVPVQSVEETDAIGLDRAALVKMYRDMLLTRGLEDRGYHPVQAGQAARLVLHRPRQRGGSVGVASAMGPGDVGAPLHRNMGVHVARGAEPWRLLCQYMGRDGGATRGRDSNLRSQDLEQGPDRRRLAPARHPADRRSASRSRSASRAQPNVALGWFGDGASARGDVHECMNFAAVRRLPMVFICDNNQYAYSTPTNLNYACEHLADRAESYGFEGVVVDGTDILAVYREAQAALGRARTGGGPTMLELVTLRMDGHAIHDDASYVPSELHAAWERKDPIARFESLAARQAGWTDEEAGCARRRRCRPTSTRRRSVADASPWPDPATVTDGVFA